MTYNDELLIKAAYKTPYWLWTDVYTSVEDADTEKAKAKLRNLASILFDIYQERGYYDPTEKEDMLTVRKARVPVLRRFMSWLLGLK